MKKLPNIHPGKILLEQFLNPMKIGAYKLSKDIGIPLTTAFELLKSNRKITPDIALKLGNYLGNSAEFWLDLQNDYDAEVAKRQNDKQLRKYIPNSGSVDKPKVKTSKLNIIPKSLNKD
jgi:addiction module HigA family antidote